MLKINLTKAALIIGASTLLITSCKKEEKKSNDFDNIKTEVLSSFVNTVGTPVYATFKDKATILNNAVLKLVSNPNATNQQEAQEAWKATRIYWEQSEGFLIGPVDDNNYDPYMDTWPTDRNELNALLAGTQPLDAAALAGYTDDETQLTLRGFHPLEYLLWKSNVSYTAREKEYMTGLSQDILNNVTKLNNDWPTFAKELTTPGGTSRYTNRQDALLALSGAFVDICSEVGEGKMFEPFNSTPPDSTKSESPYSHNSLNDFRNNLIGAYNVYLCKFDGKQGVSISDLVAANNKTLDQNIKAKFEAAINSFDNITATFEMAIYTQRIGVQNTMTAIGNLKEAVDSPLKDYIKKYVTD